MIFHRGAMTAISRGSRSAPPVDDAKEPVDPGGGRSASRQFGLRHPPGSTYLLASYRGCATRPPANGFDRSRVARYRAGRKVARSVSEEESTSRMIPGENNQRGGTHLADASSYDAGRAKSSPKRERGGVDVADDTGRE